MAHRDRDFLLNLGAKLATRSRHVCVFLGAGAAKACGLPDMGALEKKVLSDLGEPYKALFSRQLDKRSLEQALSRIRRIAALLKDSGVSTETEDSIGGLNAESAEVLDTQVRKAIVKELDISSADLKPMMDFAAWAARTDYHSPLEVFTVNYDLLLETAFEEWQVPYFDGFIGTLTARFRTELVEPLQGGPSMPSFFVRLWKIHGSLNWEWDAKHKILRRGNPVPDSAAIYPSDTRLLIQTYPLRCTPGSLSPCNASA